MERAPGQLSIWDIEIVEKPREIINRVIPKKIEKTTTSLEPTGEQQKFLAENRIMENRNLSRLIKYCGGGLGIEMLLPEGYKTIYVNKEGQEEFTKDIKLPVLPMDKILFYRENLQPNSSQEERLHDLKANYPMAKVIKRRGDENVILILENKVISITPSWVLEFWNIKVSYEENEILQAHEEIVDIEDMQRKVKPGDYVRARCGNEFIEGTIVREYGLGKEILNIVFGNKHTAIGRTFVTKILKAA